MALLDKYVPVRKRFFTLAIFLPISCFFLFPGSAKSQVSTNVPLDHWSYQAVDELIGQGLIDASMMSTKPVSRFEMARHIAEADEKFQRLNSQNEIIAGILDRLKKEFEPELATIGAIDDKPLLDYAKPVEDPYLKYVYAKSRPDIENIRGDQFNDNSNVRTGFASRAQLFDIMAFYSHIEYPSSSDGTSPAAQQIYQHDDVPSKFIHSSEDKGLKLVEGYGKLALGKFEIEAGRDSMWWGPGYHGSILMSNNAEPFDMLKLSNPSPIELPWIFKGLGPFKLVWFLTQLEDDRPIPRPNLTGLRIEFKPHPAVEIGVTRVMIFGGEGRPEYTFADYLKAWTGNNELLSGNKDNDQIGGFDASVLLPVDWLMPAKSVKLYLDGAGEDEAGGLPSKWGWLYGIKFFDIFKTGKTDLDIEYANNHVPGWPDVFYTHGVFHAGYTYNGRVIGDFMGTDSEDLFFRLTHYLSKDIILGLQYDSLRHNLSSTPQPITHAFQSDVTFFTQKNWVFNAGFRYELETSSTLPDNTILFLQATYEF